MAKQIPIYRQPWSTMYHAQMLIAFYGSAEQASEMVDKVLTNSTYKRLAEIPLFGSDIRRVAAELKTLVPV
jgi:hypothetical protein